MGEHNFFGGKRGNLDLRAQKRGTSRKKDTFYLRLWGKKGTLGFFFKTGPFCRENICPRKLCYRGKERERFFFLRIGTYIVLVPSSGGIPDKPNFVIYFSLCLSCCPQIPKGRPPLHEQRATSIFRSWYILIDTTMQIHVLIDDTL